MLLARVKRPDGSIFCGTVDATGAFFSGTPENCSVAAKDMMEFPIEGCRWLCPCEPRQFVAVWNNSRSAMERYDLSLPSHPLYFLKPYSSYACHQEVICLPPKSGRVVFEGELGVVISKECRRVPANSAADVILGFTCVNDVTAIEILHDDPSFPQWTRAKGLRGFTPFGPVICTDVDPETLVVQTLVNGRRVQNYAVSDLIFSPWELVSRISEDLTLYAGDVISCGTSVGVRPIREGDQIDVLIDGVGTLCNSFAMAAE